ncbi:unnamed protein product [Adineta steineri]|uniref:Uncharacterized protein n=1 Tax=Adineta steineri TaxID=433720 RepID=A0A815SFR0_9BILA|nr:unnamed protein product [Adineta steineri]CAF1488307.1 unnamed protein product [Adineta steineri]CAF3564740.1 unnamed protein product [Adineta steineri]CAF3743772.1 unnamed protein product [Adineta steineri]
MAKRSKYDSNANNSNEDYEMSVDDKILSSDLNNLIQATTISNTNAYHMSICGSILHPMPTNSPSDIFSFLRHSNFTALRRSLDVYHNDIIQMRNDHGQTVLHVLVIHAYQYVWVRLLMLRECDPCAQDIDGYTAAHYAVERDDVEMLKALTLRFHTQAKPISEEKITTIHNKCCKALSLKEKNGLTTFMLACQHESLKCLDYLIELNINDSNLEDKFGDTCLHYAVGRRNKNLVEKLLDTCKADANGGQQLRPSVLDILQYNRAQQKPFERTKDDDIERLLLSYGAKNRYSIRRITSKRKGSDDNNESITSNLACLSIDLKTNAQIETARSYARLGSSFEAKGDLKAAQENFQHAMMYTPDNTLEWATYALRSALIHMTYGEKQSALELLQPALYISKQHEEDSQDIGQIQQAIDQIQRQTC